MERRAHLPKVRPERGRHKQVSGNAPLLPKGVLLAGTGSPSCGLEVGPWGEVMNQIRKVIEGMHWRMHDEPSVTIGSHRGKVLYRNHRKNKTTRITNCIW